MENNLIKTVGYTTLVSSMGIALQSCGEYDDGPGFNTSTIIDVFGI
tara:strand:- start:2519 stop:2656 length:138 start_codon:yes stop_codon:yes gene_type:complete